jgi:hypothetical protein
LFVISRLPIVPLAMPYDVPPSATETAIHTRFQM